MNIINVAFNLAALATLLGILSLVVNAVRFRRVNMDLLNFFLINVATATVLITIGVLS